MIWSAGRKYCFCLFCLLLKQRSLLQQEHSLLLRKCIMAILFRLSQNRPVLLDIHHWAESTTGKRPSHLLPTKDNAVENTPVNIVPVMEEMQCK